MLTFIIFLKIFYYLYFYYPPTKDTHAVTQKRFEEIFNNGDLEEIIVVSNLNKVELSIKQNSIQKYSNSYNINSEETGPHF